jgi:hypothetical protein
VGSVQSQVRETHRNAGGNEREAQRDVGPEAFQLDRPGIRTSFDRASARYEAAAVLQARVGAELIGRL